MAFNRSPDLCSVLLSLPGRQRVALTCRDELGILRLVADGLSNKEIALKLSLAEGTVKNYVTNVLAKIDARDRTQAALKARELGLL